MDKKHLSKKNIVILLVLTVLFIWGIFYYFYTRTPVYDTAEAKRANITQVIFASGEMRSEDEVELKFPVSGKLRTLDIDVNDRVKKGQIMAVLDQRILFENLAKTESQKVAAQAAYDELINASGGWGNSDPQIANQKTQYQEAWERAKNDVAIAKSNLSDSVLLASFDGVVTKVHTHEGTSVVAGTTPIITIANPETISFIAEVGESDIANVSLGQAALVELDAFSDKKFVGKVTEVDYAATATNGNKVYNVKIALDEKDNVKLDMSGEAEISTVSHEGALVIPKLAIQQKADKKFVELLENSQVRQKEVTTGLKGKDGMIEILSGVNEGDKVILPSNKK